MSSNRDIHADMKVATTIAPQAALTADTTGSAVDTVGYRSAMVVIQAGAATDGTFTPTLEESDSSGSGYTTVAAGDLGGSFSANTNATSNTVQKVSYLGQKRYLRVKLTETVASAGQFIAATIVLGDPLTRPAS